MSFVGRDLERVGRNEFVPAREFQMRWIRLYLASYRDCHPQMVIGFKVLGGKSTLKKKKTVKNSVLKVMMEPKSCNK